MFRWRIGSPFQQPPEQELRFPAPCLTADMWRIAMPVVVHYRIADGRILAREPSAMALITQMLAGPIAEEASRLSLADVNRHRERLRNAATGTPAGRDALNSEIVRHIRSRFGIRIVDLFVNSPELDPEIGRAIADAAAQKLAARQALEHRNDETETARLRLGQILKLADWTPEQKRLLSEAYLRAEAIAHVEGGDTISCILNA